MFGGYFLFTLLDDQVGCTAWVSTRLADLFNYSY